MIEVNGDRLIGDLATLARIGAREGGGISRTALSPDDVLARRWYRDRCAEAGLNLSFDGLGNMTARQPGDDQGAPAIWSGSHIDTVPNGGALDGAYGTVAALECLRRLAEEGLPLPRPVRAMVFTDEEGNYGHLLGSYGLINGYSPAALESMVGRDGDRLVDTWTDYPFRSAQPIEPIDPAVVAGFVELHIEQGPKLEAAGLDIGVVSSIVGLGGGRMEFRGRADHAGTTPMSMRADALLAAADFLTALPRLAAGVSEAAVATCGILRLAPDAANVVPEVATCTLDLRETTRTGVAALYAAVGAGATEAAERHGSGVVWHPDDIIDPVVMDTSVQEVIRDACDSHGFSRQDMPSGAGHDSQNLAKVTPTGMIFVPSHEGRSHCPAEHTDPRLLVQGANVLLSTLITLAS
jgi:N-carbamoyl-L-amino-acid hydrolase